MALSVPVTPPQATYQDVLDAPEGLVAELLDGALHLQPRPMPRHARAASALQTRLGMPFDQGVGGPGGWVILSEVELHLGSAVLVPDLAGWRRERLTEMPDTVGVTVPPDWVCEVLSPGTRRLDISGKRHVYGTAGIPYLWFVDPDAQTIEAFEWVEGRWTVLATHAGDAEAAIPPFDQVPLPLGRLWAL